MFPKSDYPAPPMNAATATTYVRRLVELETRGSGDMEGALRRLETHFGLPFWPMWHLRKGRAKTVSAELFGQIRVAYLCYCEKKIAALQGELASEKALSPDVDLEGLEAKASELAAEIKAAKIARLVQRGRG